MLWFASIPASLPSRSAVIDSYKPANWVFLKAAGPFAEKIASLTRMRRGTKSVLRIRMSTINRRTVINRLTLATGAMLPSRRRQLSLLMGLIVGAFVFDLPNASRAQSRIWNVPFGSFADPANWTSGSPSGSDSIIDNGGTSQVLRPGLHVLDLTVGHAASGTLEILDGGSLGSRYSELGWLAGSEGWATVKGENSSWTSSIVLRVGTNGTGHLTVSDGGSVSSDTGRIGNGSGSHGTAIVTGENSAWTSPSSISVGYVGSGEMSVAQGGKVSASQVFIGHYDSGEGTVTVADEGSTLTANSIEVGASGVGRLTIAGGGAVTTTIGRIGSVYSDLGIVLVTGANSKWTSANLLIGGQGTAELTVSEKGEVRSSGSLEIAERGNGTLRIASDGLVTVSEDTRLGSYTGQGKIVFDRATLQTGGLVSALDDLSGTGVINTGGLVTDLHLHFDRDHELQQQLRLNSEPNQDIEINLAVSDAGALGAGYREEGSLTIADGRVVPSRVGYLGFHGGSTGEAVVTGANSKWISAGDLSVGYGGKAELSITQGATVSSGRGMVGICPSSDALVTISGMGSSWINTGELLVGLEGSGNLVVENGSAVYSASGSIGRWYRSHGTVRISGDGSKWINDGQIDVGKEGSGILTIEGGGLVSNTEGWVGAIHDAGKVTVTGVGSQWLNSADLHLGIQATAELAIADGGRVSNTNATMAKFFSNAVATATVSGLGSFWTNNGQLEVGGTGVAKLSVLDGGVVSATNGVAIGARSTVLGNGKIIGDVLNSGTVAPGASPGDLRITGNYTQSDAAKLSIELGSVDNYDSLAISGRAELSGTLDVSLIEGFTPQIGQRFSVLSAAGGVSGRFEELLLPEVNDGDWQLLYTTDLVLLQLAMHGDYNLDGMVDAADYVVWRKTDGTQLEYDTWRANFGRTAGGASLANRPIPEPNTLIIFFSALLTVFLSRRSAESTT